MPHDQGYIRLPRALQTDPLWTENKEFTRLQAFEDIIFEARWAEDPGQVAIGLRTLTCKQGEVLYSLDKWARRWGWTKSKTRRFLKALQARNKIEYANETETIRLTVCQLESYIGRRNGHESVGDTAADTETERGRNARETRTKPTQEGKKGRREEYPPTPQPGGRSPRTRKRKGQRVTENTALMVRVGRWFGRKPGTLWTVAEAEALKLLGGVPAEEVEVLEAYYTATIEKDDFRRQKPETLLNNWPSEVDRARKWQRKVRPAGEGATYRRLSEGDD